LSKPVPALPQPEPAFSVVQVDPSEFEPLLKRSHLILILEIDTVTNRELIENFWAKPQRVLSYKAKTEQELEVLLRTYLDEDLKKIRDFDRVQMLRKLTAQEAPPSSLAKQLGLELKLPASYELSTDEEGVSVYWSRNLKSDQALMIYTRPLTDEALMGTDILNVRDSICKKYIPGEVEGSYMITEREFSPEIVPIQLAGVYGFETRGLWKVHGDFMGGPFLNYTLIDEAREQVITIEGFVFGPQMRKRNLVFELEAIIKSARLNS
jgi:hypothetical protein